MKDYERFEVWQVSHALTLKVYRVTNSFPRDELFGLTSQMRRAAVSIPANIAEGCGRDTDADFKRFLDIAYGSAAEVDYCVILSRELSYIDAAATTELRANLQSIRRMLAALIKKLKSDSQKPTADRR